MKQVIQSTKTGKLQLKEVPAPKVKPGHLLVSTRASLISAGTERMVVEFARKSLAGKAKARPDLVKKVLDKARRDGLKATFQSVMARLDEPLPLGYSAAGDVVAVGAGLEGRFRVGDRVAVAGAGLANHAELNVVPELLAAPIPDDVPYDEACFGTLGAIAMHAFRNLEAGLGDVVGVVGVGLLGQLAVQFLTLAGCRAIALDYAPDKLELATKSGAEAAISLADSDVERRIHDLTGGRGCDRVLIAAATKSSEPFEMAAAIARDRARVVMVGLTGTTFPYQGFMKKELNLVVSRSYGPGRYDPDFEGRGIKYPEGWVRWTETENLAEVLRLMSLPEDKRLDVAGLTTHYFPVGDAESAYTMVTEGTEPHLGVVLRYPETAATAPALSFPEPKGTTSGKCVLGVIGAGGFAKAVLLPALKKMNNVELHTLVTQRGSTSEHGQQTFGFQHASGDEAAVLDNPDINAVLVATRHDSHGDLTARALAAGKSVLVEKPLGLTLDELNGVAEARNGSDGFFQIGFNRRFAPLSVRLRDKLAKAEGNKFVLLRVNAGHIPAESWVHAADEGGGRILGEVCHFVDLARFYVGAPIASVQADAARAVETGADDVSISLRFTDGSLATIAYTGLGDVAYSKERFEAYAGGSVVTVDNFRSITEVDGGTIKTESGKTQDKGFGPALNAFVDSVVSGGPAPIDEAELMETSRATIMVLESLRTGERIDL